MFAKTSLSEGLPHPIVERGSLARGPAEARPGRCPGRGSPRVIRQLIHLAQAISALSVYAPNNGGHVGVVVRAAVGDGGRNEHNEEHDDETHRSSLVDGAFGAVALVAQPQGNQRREETRVVSNVLRGCSWESRKGGASW